MKSIHVRDIINMNNHQAQAMVLDNDIKAIDITFDDNAVVRSTGKELIYSSYFWDMFRKWPQTPILGRHHVSHVLKGNPLTSNTHIELLAILNADICTAYSFITPESKEPVLAAIYEVTNNIHNEVTKLGEADVISIDILDFIEVVNHPEVKAAVDGTEANHTSITATYNKISQVINSDPNLAHNNVAKAIKAKMVNANQVSQCVAVRGFPTEVDGSILKTPILSNYAIGMNSMYDYVAESRSAAKALYFAEAPLQDAEYFARRLQLLAMVVERVHTGDCGSTDYVLWRVNPPLIDERGNVTYPGDLKFMSGKFYLDEATGELKEIKGNEVNLNNGLIKLRSVLSCRHEDHHGVCSTCFGGLSRNVSKYANLGHLCAATMTQQTSQSVLSSKHLDASSVSASINITGEASKFLTTNRAKNAYLVRKEIKELAPRMIVPREEAIGLTDILAVDDTSNINPLRVSSVTTVDFKTVQNGLEFTNSISVNQGNRRAILTSEFLAYLKEKRWETDSQNNFVFDLSDWNYVLPIMRLPDMEYSYSDHSHQIAKVIESSMKNITDRSAPNSSVFTLQELFALVNSKLNVNIAALEVLIYAMMIPTKDSNGLSRNRPGSVLGIADVVIKSRSLGAALAFEDQTVTLVNPQSFFKLDRVDGPLDAMIAPQEVVQHYRKIGRA